MSNLRSSLASLVFLAAACTSSDGVPEPGRTQLAVASLPDLGAAESFAILAGSTVTNSGPSMIVGDVGVFPGTEIVGFPPGMVIDGALHSADGPAGAAQDSLTTAYNDLAGQACDTNLTDMDLGGMTLMPAVYCFNTSAQLTGTLTLDGMGDPNAVWLFQVGSTLTTASDSAVNMIGGGIPGRVFWQIGSSATLGTGTDFSGNILAEVSITGTTGASIAGRALARTGAVTIDTMDGEAVPLVQPGVADAGIMLDADVPLDADVFAPDAEPDAQIDQQGALSGGSPFDCSAAPSTASRRHVGAVLIGLVFLCFFAVGVYIRARRRRASRVLPVLLAMMLPGFASAQSVTLEQFRAPETADDGLAVSRPVDLDGNRLSALVYLSYANDPLVFERIAGDPDSEEQSVVNHQLTMQLGIAYGVMERLVLFGGATANVLMIGDSRPGTVEADGSGLGDLFVGARFRLLGKPRLGVSSYGALALQIAVALPTSSWIHDSRLGGEGGLMVTPELLAEVGGRSLRVTLNAGARLRGTEDLGTLSIGHELTWGVGVGVPLSGMALELDVEAYGATAMDDMFARQTTPVEAIAGLRWRGTSGWTAAIGAGPGLTRGYGAPDFRAIATIGWTEPMPAAVIASEPVAEVAPPAEPSDLDGDGVLDADDKCPRVPGPPDNAGCARFVALVPTEEAPAEIVISQRIEFATDEDTKLRPESEAVLEEVRALLEANPHLKKIAIEGHADERMSDAHNQGLSQRRAQSVKDWLVARGIDANRLEARGYGETEPFTEGTTRANQQTNRNVQFFVLDPAPSNPNR